MNHPQYNNNGATPDAEYYYATPSPTPSPRGHGTYYYPSTTPQRPATRAHFRHTSTSGPPPQTFSPRYTSDGQYATANVSSSRKHSGSSSRTKRERRNSYSYNRTPFSHGDSDEDEVYEVDGVVYVMLGRSNSRKFKDYYDARGYATNHSYEQAFDREMRETTPRPEDTPRRSHARRASTSVPQRPQTAKPMAARPQPQPQPQPIPIQRPQTAQQKKPPPPGRQASEADARKHKIPDGYSLKNWDPAEEPILLLGSVFDANSLGKWIYDWTVYHHGAATPLSDMAGELWLLMIQLAGKVKRAEETAPKIRNTENKDMVEDFIESGDRLSDKFRKLIKSCEAPMLKAANSRKGTPQLGMDSGIEFVKTLFGRERELEKTEKYMQSVRLWNLRFDANCSEILDNPTK